MPAYHVLCTKKIAPQLVQQAAQEGIEIIEKEFIHITPVISEGKYQEIISAVTSDTQHIVFTSANAAGIVCSYLAGLNTASLMVWCLGGKTRESLIPCFNDEQIAGTATHASALADMILQQDIKSIVFFCGNKRRNELPEKLNASGVTVHEVIVYETTEVSFRAMEDEVFDGVMFFSPSAVSSFFSANTIVADTVCFAIGHTTAAAIKNCTQNRIVTSDLPDEKIMMDSVKLYFQHN